ncbi:putative crocetin glucosyltransferase [Helianthus annuus]|nr:putative crocetin glucosyltransferase [Helianthus annuus]
MFGTNIIQVHHKYHHQTTYPPSSSSPYSVNSTNIQSTMVESFSHYVVAIPYPGRGHINPMMNLCKLIALRRPSDFLITFIVTEEWLGFIECEPKPPNIQFATIPNVIPSEVNRAADFPGFVKATQTKMEHPVEQLLHRMGVPISVLLYDTYFTWVLGIGNRMNIPVASLFTMSATVFSMMYHYHLRVENGHVGENFSGNTEEIVDCIPGVPPIRVADLVTGFNGKSKETTSIALDAILMSAKAQFLIFVSVYELEAEVIDALKSTLSIPIYAIGPSIPYFSLNDVQNDENTPDYIKWLDRQPEGSVLYISQGSFLSVSSAQLDEIVAGVQDSGIRYMWIARGETSRFKRENDEKGIVVPWCDQLRVLCHSSVGAFWSHCGWNSTKEAAFSGKPMITFPIVWDQVPNSKMIVEDWKTGRRVMIDERTMVTRAEISKLISSFMDPDSKTGKEIRKRAKEVERICRRATREGSSCQIDIDSFIRDISK